MKRLLNALLLSLSMASTQVFAIAINFPSLEEVQKKITNINTSELQTLIETEKDMVLIDVRTPNEIAFINGEIDALQNVNIPRGWLEFRIAEAVPDKQTTIVVYCGTNQRSPYAADTLIKMGYRNVKNYADGFAAWQQANLPVEPVDKAPDSILYSKPEKIIDGVYSAIGATAPRTYANSGHNNNLTFIVSDDGVMVINAGDSYLLAKSLHEEIKKVTDQPVKYVVLENAQGHAMHGSNYWKEQGVPIIAHKDTIKELEEYGNEFYGQMLEVSKDKAFGTELTMPDKTFEDKMEIQLGKEKIELLHLGPAHSPGDIMVWLPEKSLIITGDMAFHERMLPVFEHTNTAGWLETWEKFAALDAKIVLPGHGGVTNMEEVTKYTKDYLKYMREEVGKVIEDGGDLQAAYAIDQSAFSHLDTYDILKRLNAGRIFREMEFE